MAQMPKVCWVDDEVLLVRYCAERNRDHAKGWSLVDAAASPACSSRRYKGLDPYNRC